MATAKEYYLYHAQAGLDEIQIDVRMLRLPCSYAEVSAQA
jgi:hypothetical protein